MQFNKQKTIGYLAHLFSKLLLKTLRVQYHFHPELDFQKQYVYGFWHGKQFAPVMLMASIVKRKQIALVSASKDGEILSTWLRCMGYEVVRGSSSRKAISSLVKLITAAKAGYVVGIAADGPRGPRLEAKSGVAFVASKAQLAFVPLGVAYSHKWQFNKAWDHYQLPRPFAKVSFYFGKPLEVRPIQDRACSNQIVAEAINHSEAEAHSVLFGE